MARCVPEEDHAAATDRLRRSAFELGRIDRPDGGANFYLAHGDWIRLLHRNGFEIEDLVELRPDADATTRYPFVSLDWARRWPCEEVWKVRRIRAGPRVTRRRHPNHGATCLGSLGIRR